MSDSLHISSRLSTSTMDAFAASWHVIVVGRNVGTTSGQMV
jgi:hypothetical protein